MFKMAKFCGKIGFVMEEEVSEGNFEPKEVVRLYRGDVLKTTIGWQKNSDTINDDITINNTRISIVADSFVLTNNSFLKWVEYQGTRWKVISIDPEYPRLTLTLGGIYVD